LPIFFWFFGRLTVLHKVEQSQTPSMGDLQDPIDEGTLVPYFWPYFLGIFPYNGHWLQIKHPQNPPALPGGALLRDATPRANSTGPAQLEQRCSWGEKRMAVW
jgi:hypothetical protein